MIENSEAKITALSEKFANYQAEPATYARPEVLRLLLQERDFYQNIAEFLQGLTKLSVGTILVVGGGSGSFGNVLSEKFPECKIYDFDLNHSTCKFSQNHNLGKFCLSCSADSLPFVEKSFDVVVAYGIFRYLSDSERSVLEINRVMKSGGLGFVGEGKDRKTIQKVQAAMGKIQENTGYGELKNILMPRLTFGYALVENYGKDSRVTELINSCADEENIDIFEAAFKIAGFSESSVYSVYWNRQT